MKGLTDGKPQMARPVGGAPSKASSGASGEKEKLLQQFKKEINKELKKARDDSSSTITRCLDGELERYADFYSETGYKDLSQSEHSSLLAYLSGINDLENLAGSAPKNSWASIFHLVNFFHSFSDLLGLDRVILDSFVRSLELVSSDGAARDSSTAPAAREMDLTTETSAETKEQNIFKSFANIDSAQENEMEIDLRGEFCIDNEAEIFFDKAQLAMARLCSLELAALLDGSENTGDSSKKDKSAPSFSFPVNQLTWQEITRMALVSVVMKSMDSQKEDILHAIKGSKASMFPIAKNVARAIRYRMAYNAQEDTVQGTTKGILLENRPASEDLIFMRKFKVEPSRLNILSPVEMKSLVDAVEDKGNSTHFTSIITSDIIPSMKYVDIGEGPISEAGILDLLTKTLEDESISEDYRRCISVLLKVMNMNAAKNFFWDIDDENFADYCNSMRQPISFFTVSIKLLQSVYDSDGSVGAQFYIDLRQVLLNCISVNTEATGLVAQAQKLLPVIHRHVDRWVLSSDRQSLNRCNEKFCVMSGEAIENIPNIITSVKCGRCCGVFSIKFLESNKATTTGIYDMSTELITSPHEAWLCPLCLQDRSCDESFSRSFYIDEWGPSAQIPWILNSNHCTRIDQISDSVIVNMMDAIKLLACDDSTSLKSENPKLKRWTMSERATVLTALVDLTLASSKTQNWTLSNFDTCQKLSKIANSEPFRTGDFLNAVCSVAGEQAAYLTRKILTQDSASKHDENNDYQFNSYTRIMDGRCIICRRFTDPQEGDVDDQKVVVICDGCSSEVHLACLKLEKVPTDEWYCEACRQMGHGKVDTNRYHSAFYTLIDNARRGDIEDKLLKHYAQFNYGSGPKREFGKDTCDYCYKTELELCSPLVVGQSLPEFFEFQSKFTKPSISTQPRIPFFPLASDQTKTKFLSNSELVKSPVTHEMCALNMHRNRIDMKKAEFRKLRKTISKKATQALGLYLEPLGRDDEARVYWKFPTSPDLFVHVSYLVDDEYKVALKDGLQDISVTNSLGKDEYWYRVCGTENINTLIGLLGLSKHESSLRSALLSTFTFLPMLSDPAELSKKPEIYSHQRVKSREELTGIEDKSTEPFDIVSNVFSSENVDGSSSMIQKGEEAFDENAIVEMTFVKEKGLSIPPYILIREEDVYEPLDKDFDDDMYLNFFTYTKKFYAVALVNSRGRKVKLKKNAATVTYQIFREGYPQSLAFTPLSEQWSDNMYYFQTINFRRSGHYLVSFHLEGLEYAKVKPLYYPVKVESERVNFGSRYALTQLRAQGFLSNPGRQNLSGKRDFVDSSGDPRDECEAVKHCLLTFYFALPVGSVTMGQELKSNENVFDCISEAVGWNDIIDQMWRNLVMNARSANKLMESLLLLEFYINKTWLTSAQKLYNALPNAHFAIRCSTFSSVALRIFALDSCMSYEKVQSLPRLQRTIASAASSSAPVVDVQPSRKADVAPVHVAQRKSRPAPNNRYVSESEKSESEEESDEEEESSEASVSDDSGGRRKRPSRAAANKMSRASPAARRPPRRAAAVSASNKLRDVDSDDSDGSDARPSASNRPSARTLPRETSQWRCTFCTCLNEMRARSCQVCGSRKAANAEIIGDKAESVSPSAAPAKSTSKRGRVVHDDSDNDESEIAMRLSDGKWVCQTCTFENDQRARSCEVCSTKKSLNPPPSGNSRRPAKQSSREQEEIEVDLPYQVDRVGYVDFVKLVDENRENLRVDKTCEKQFEYDLKARGSYILRAFQLDDKCYPFWYPVDLEEVSDYLSFVSNPMDLLTITKKLVSGSYGSKYELFKNDLLLVWSNAKAYNLPGSNLYSDANKFEKLSRELIKRWIDEKEDFDEMDLRPM